MPTASVSPGDLTRHANYQAPAQTYRIKNSASGAPQSVFNDSSMFEIFSRLNSGGILLKAQEIRMSLYYSAFYERIVQDAPTIETTAIWYKNTRPESDFVNKHYCSHCGNYATHTSMYSHIKERDLPDIEFTTDFCPNCGYKMIEVE